MIWHHSLIEVQISEGNGKQHTIYSTCAWSTTSQFIFVFTILQLIITISWVQLKTAQIPAVVIVTHFDNHDLNKHHKLWSFFIYMKLNYIIDSDDYHFKGGYLKTSLLATFNRAEMSFCTSHLYIKVLLLHLGCGSYQNQLCRSMSDMSGTSLRYTKPVSQYHFFEDSSLNFCGFKAGVCKF